MKTTRKDQTQPEPKPIGNVTENADGTIDITIDQKEYDKYIKELDHETEDIIAEMERIDPTFFDDD